MKEINEGALFQNVFYLYKKEMSLFIPLQKKEY